MSVTPTTSGTTPTTAANQQQYVTITQPDGSTYRVPMTRATWDPEAKAWVSNPSAEAVQAANQINKKYNAGLQADDFMKLLVAQMRYQDPSKPADTAQMMQQTASMGMIERVNEMATSAESMAKAVEALTETNKTGQAAYASMLVEQRMSSAVTLVGKQIGYADAADPKKTVTGVVDSVRFDTSGPILVVGGKDVPLASVSSVTSGSGAPTPPSSAGSDTPPTA